MRKGIGKYSLNDNYFEKIDTIGKAYFLGLLVSDGNIFNNNITIALQERDKDILYTLSNLINYQGNIKIKNPKNEKYSKMYCLRIFSREMTLDLSKLGVIPAKSHHTYFPPIEEKYWSHFIRGVFDGDGCINISKTWDKRINITGNKTLIERIQEILIEKCSLNKTKLSPCKICKGNIVTLWHGGNNIIKKLYNYLYNNCEDLYLKSKRDKFLLERPKKEEKKCLMCNNSVCYLNLCIRHYQSLAYYRTKYKLSTEQFLIMKGYTYKTFK